MPEPSASLFRSVGSRDTIPRMVFDIHEDLHGREGWLSEEHAGRYEESLIDLFAESPEGRELLETEEDLGWAALQIGMGIKYEGVTPPRTSAADLWAILFEWFPKKVTTEPSKARSIIRQVRALWRFLARDCALENAPACLEILDDEAAPRLEREMGDPANFGPAKSFAMFAAEAGFDLATEEGYAAAILAFNARAAATPALPPLEPPGNFSLAIPADAGSSAGGSRKGRKAGRKARRKAARASRKKNRRKK